MDTRIRRIDVSDTPQLADLAEAVRRAGDAVVLTRNDEDMAIIEPIASPESDEATIPIGEPFTMDDPLWGIVGMGQSEGPTDVSARKHKYLADAQEPPEE